MKKTIAAATVAALFGVAGAASAADLYAPGLKDGPAYAAPVNSWTGFHIGVGVGGEAVNYDLTASARKHSIELDGISGTGVIGTAEVGYDRQFGSIVGGIFFNYDFGDNVSTDLNIDSTNVASLKQTDSWTVGGRLGYLVNPSTLAYALAGYTETTFEGTLGSYSQDETLNGWTVGGGLETKLAANWTLKGEYRFTELDTKSFDLGRRASLDVDTTVQSARAVLSYKFNLFGDDALPLPLK